MIPNNTKTYIINIQLMKLIGFHQLLNPNASTIFGYNIYKLGGHMSILCNLLNIILCNMSIYYALYDFTSVVRYILFMFASFFIVIKMWFIITKSDVLWTFISFTSIDFLSYSGHQKCILMKARTKSIEISYIFTGLWVSIIAFLNFSPIIMNDSYLYVKSKDGTHNQYRYNVLNIIFPVSTQFYNDNFYVFYLFEIIPLIIYGYVTIIFDCLVIAFSITIAFQLKMIASSYNTLGYNHANTDKKTSEENLQSMNEKNKDLFNLILIIKDHQKLMKKIHEIYEVLRPLILFELLSEAVLMSLIPFTIFSNTKNGVPLTSPESIKLILGTIITSIQLFSTCYLFGQINKYNDEINFALYSCNWTEMSIKFKKLLLLTMHINNANNFKLNVSTNIIVNLQLYTSVIHTTYKILSVAQSLLN